MYYYIIFKFLQNDNFLNILLKVYKSEEYSYVFNNNMYS